LPQRIEAQSRATPEQIVKLGLTLMRLEERMDKLKEHFGVATKSWAWTWAASSRSCEATSFKALERVRKV
jgi:hypothetical protein